MYQLKLDRFEGPLDLLLQLIERQELNINDVSLAAVTEQYLDYLEKSHDLLPEDLADFLVVAAKLLLIKSRTLLPDLFPEDSEEEDLGLAEQLAIYKQYVEASHKIGRRLRRRTFMYAKERLPIMEAPAFSPPHNLTADVLRQFCEKILENLEKFVRPAAEIIKRTISLQEKILTLRKLLEAGTEIDFKRLVIDARSRMEIIVSFLAILELVKQRYAVARQDSRGGSIMLVRVE